MRGAIAAALGFRRIVTRFFEDPSVTRLFEDGTTRLFEDGTTRVTEGL